MRGTPATRARATWLALGVLAAICTTLVFAHTPLDATAHTPDPHPALAGASTGTSTDTGPGTDAAVVAHRGNSSDAPENTLASVRSSLDAGMRIIELDLHLTADEQIALMHDRSVNRTTNGSGMVSAMTASDLQSLDAGSWFAEQFVNERVPLIGDVLSEVAGHQVTLFLELKSTWSEAGVALLIDQITEHEMHEQVVVLSFATRTLALVRDENPDMARIYLTSVLTENTPHDAARLGVQGVGSRLNQFELHPDMTRRLHAIGVTTLAYTLNDVRSWSRATLLGVAFIATDDPVRLDRWLS